MMSAALSFARCRVTGKRCGTIGVRRTGQASEGPMGQESSRTEVGGMNDAVAQTFASGYPGRRSGTGNGGFLRHLLGDSPELRRNILRIFLVLLLFNGVLWGLTLLVSTRYSFVLSLALLAYTFG